VVSGDLSLAEASWSVYLLPTAGMLCLASGTVLTRRLNPPEGRFQTITMYAVVAAVILMAVALMTGQAAPPADPDFWAAVTWLVVLASLGVRDECVRHQGTRCHDEHAALSHPSHHKMLWVLLMFVEQLTPLALIGLLVSAAGVLRCRCWQQYLQST